MLCQKRVLFVCLTIGQEFGDRIRLHSASGFNRTPDAACRYPFRQLVTATVVDRRRESHKAADRQPVAACGDPGTMERITTSRRGLYTPAAWRPLRRNGAAWRRTATPAPPAAQQRTASCRTADLPVSRGMGKALPDVRDAGQKDRLIPMTRIGAVDVLVPMVGIRTVFHQMTVSVIRPGRFLRRHHPREFALQIVDKSALGIVPDDVGGVEHDMPAAQLVGRRKHTHEPDLPLAAGIAGRNRAGNDLPRADLAQQNPSPSLPQCTKKPILDCCIRSTASISQVGQSNSGAMRRMHLPMVSRLLPKRTSNSAHIVK